MAKTRLAKVVLTIKGVWSPTVEYEKLDLVNYLGSSYIAKRDNIGVTPVEGDDWSLSAEKGGKGDQGDKIYLHIAYANSEDGETDFTTSPVVDKVYTYLGSYSDYIPEDSNVPSTYVWSKLTEEAERAAAELLRVAAEEERVAAETDRKSAESQRDRAESDRNIAELDRALNESARETAETSRVSAENTRDISETKRVNAEISRDNAETARVNAEDTRVLAEQERATAESARVAAEDARVSAENTRAETFSGYENRIAEAESTAQSVRDDADAGKFNGKDAPQESVLYTAQSLSDEQRAQARENIAAAGVERVRKVEDALPGKMDNAPGTWPEWTADEQAAARERLGIPGDYELIASVELTEDTANEISIAEDINAEKISLKSCIVRAETPAIEGNKNMWFSAMPALDTAFVDSIRFQATVITTKQNIITCQFNRDGVVIPLLVSITGYKYPSVLPSYTVGYTVKKLLFSAAGGEALPAGVKIVVYGVRE